MSKGIAIAGLILVIAFGALSVVSTYGVFSHTFDEPAHIAAGMELLKHGSFTFEQQHPPLARIAVALGPYVLGATSHDKPEVFEEGLAILYGSGDYTTTLTAARLGVLPFFSGLVAIAWLWAYRDFGPVAAFITAAITATTTPLLAHAGLATTDMPLTATFLSALFAFRCWLSKPNLLRGLLLGITSILAITAKLSALVFLPTCFVTSMLLCRLCNREAPSEWSFREILASLSAGLAVSGIAAWVIYGCPANPLQPLGQLSAGVAEVLEHNAKGHISFFSGQISFTGNWLFFPTALLLKTPLPFLCLIGFGVFVVFRHHWLDWRYLGPLASALVVVGIAMLSRVNLGSRYVLPFYPLAAMIAGIGGAQLLTGFWIARAVLSTLLIGQFVVSISTAPDYLAYFNLLAGSHPEKMLVDSDLDWGQDVKRVAVELRRRGINKVATALHGNADLSQHGFPAYSDLEWYDAATGWIAISLTRWAFGTARPPYDGYQWLERYRPVAMIGKTVRLYHIE